MSFFQLIIKTVFGKLCLICFVYIEVLVYEIFIFIAFLIFKFLPFCLYFSHG